MSLEALRGYVVSRKEKKAMYERALDARKRIKQQQTLFKMIRVAAYWTSKADTQGKPIVGQASSYELRQKAAFARWKNISILARC